MKGINILILLTLLLGLSSCHKSKLDKVFFITTYDGTVEVNDRKCEFKDKSIALIPQYVATYDRIDDYFVLRFSMRAEDCVTNEKCSFRAQLTFKGRLPEQGKKFPIKLVTKLEEWTPAMGETGWAQFMWAPKTSSIDVSGHNGERAILNAESISDGYVVVDNIGATGESEKVYVFGLHFEFNGEVTGGNNGDISLPVKVKGENIIFRSVVPDEMGPVYFPVQYADGNLFVPDNFFQQ